MIHDVNLITLPKLDPRHQIRATAPIGSTVAELIERSLPGLAPDRIRATIGDQVILPGNRARVRPKPGAVVILRVLPAGDRDMLRSVLLIAVTIAAVAVGQLWLGPLIASSIGATGVAANFVTSVSTTALMIGGTMLVNALIPPRQALSDETPSPTYSIQGWKNVANPNGIIPSVLGSHRMAPPFGAYPYTEVVGDDQFITALFIFGYGPVVIRNIRIGETPIGDFHDVTMEIREGHPGDAPITLYSQQVIEDALSAALTVKAGATRRVTASDVTGASVDITFPGGLVSIRSQDKKARQLPMTVAFNLRQRPFGSAVWQDLPPIEITGKQAGKALRRTIRWDFPTRGRWEIELTRTTQDWDDFDQTDMPIQIVSRSSWTALRSYRPEYPINFDKPLALAAVRIRATEQLNGSLDDFNADVSSICRDWDGSAWVVRETQNPAALFRHVLQGPAMTYPLEDSEIAALEDWHEFCRVRGLKYNRVHDYEASVLDVLGDIAAAGRASPHDTGTAWGVVIDRAMTLIEGHVSPRNSWGFSGERTYSERPDAFRVRFMDETNSFQNAERIVPFPDFTGDDPKVTEELQMPGITNPDLVWKEARRRQYELIHRPDTYTASQDFEHIVHTRGSLVRLSHDVLDRTQKSGRVRSVDAAAGMVRLDELVTMVAGQNYACRFRRDDGQSLLRTVVTVPSETEVLTLAGSGDLPAAGDLAFFGIATRESSEVIVKGIEVSDNLTGRMTFVDHAPQIEALTDAEVPPPWDGRAGGPIVLVDGSPPVPVITSILSSQQLGDDRDAIMVMLAPGSGAISTARYEVRHRVVGAPAWSTAFASSGSASASLSGYVSGDEVEIGARAESYGGALSAWTATQTHEIGINDTVVPPISFFTAERQGSGAWRYDWAIGDVPPGRERAEIEGVRIRAKLGVWGAYADLDDLHSGFLRSSPWEVSAPANNEIHTIGIAAVTESGARGQATLILAGRWRNLLEHSDDPQAWASSHSGITFGAQVADPLGGMRARSIAFPADSGSIIVGATLPGSPGGKTFTLALYVRAPAGKASIVLVANTDSIFNATEISLSNGWQRVSKTITCGGADTYVALGLFNAGSAGSTNPSAGVVEVFGGMIEEASVASAYQSRP